MNRSMKPGESTLRLKKSGADLAKFFANRVGKDMVDSISRQERLIL
jgi:hypothetical protein